MNTKGKKQIIAKKMGGQVIGRPNSWTKKIEPRNGEKELDAVMFTGPDTRNEKTLRKTKESKLGIGWIN